MARRDAYEFAKLGTVSLSDIELRVLGSLVEKERTTPENYPLSTNALVLACNQRSNREPVTSYDSLEIEATLRTLSDKGLTESSRGMSERAVKHHHKLAEALDVRGKDLAVLAVLMLRGLQTPGELRTRTERYTHFPDVAAVEESLTRLGERRTPLIKNHGRGPGQSQDRWGHTLGVDPEKLKPRVRGAEAPVNTQSVSTRSSERTSASLAHQNELGALRREVAELKAQVARLMAHVGLSEED